jgi:sulfate/thiosulfate transport system substrate-binding protein
MLLQTSSFLRRSFLRSALGCGILSLGVGSALAQTSLLNVSYDVSREFYKDYNAVFAAHWKKAMGETLTLNQSHGGSREQAQKEHFDDGGLYDQVILSSKKR